MNNGLKAGSDQNGIPIIATTDDFGVIRHVKQLRVWGNRCANNPKGLMVLATTNAVLDALDLRWNEVENNGNGMIFEQETDGIISNYHSFPGWSINNAGWGLSAKTQIQSGVTEALWLTGNPSGDYWCGWGMTFVNRTPQLC